jgi:hypothetical protein
MQNEKRCAVQEWSAYGPKWLDRNRGGYHYCTRGSAAQSQIVPGQTLMARGGKTAARNRSSVVSRRTAVPDAISEILLGVGWDVIVVREVDRTEGGLWFVYRYLWMCGLCEEADFFSWCVMTSGYCGFITEVILFDLAPRIKMWCRMINLESIDCHSYRHLL